MEFLGKFGIPSENTLVSCFYWMIGKSLSVAFAFSHYLVCPSSLMKCPVVSTFSGKWNGTVLSTGRFLSGADSSCLMFVAISYCIIWRKILDCFTQTSIAFRSLPLFRQSPSTLYSFIIACEQALRLTRKKETSLLTGYIKMDFFFARHRTENTTTWA